MADKIAPYAGEFLISPAGLELSMNWCGHACTYCFANLTKPNRVADVHAVMSLLRDYPQRKSREARLLQSGAPMLVSNHVDPFAGTNADQFEPIWEVCVETGVQLTWQTRGAHAPQRKFLDRVVRETPRSVWYISIPMLNDDVRKRVEPRAPSIQSRLELVQQLIEAGHVVTVGVNPLSVEWMPNFGDLFDQLKAVGVWGLWVQVPYFGKEFKDNLSADATARIGEDFIKQCGGKGSKIDRDHATAAMNYAKAIGLQVFATEYEEPTQFFAPWHDVYRRPMPYWHQLVNEIDPLLDGADDDEYVWVTRENAQSVLSPLPELDWSEVLRHKRAKHYRSIVQLLPNGRLPKQDVKGLWGIMWNDDTFAKSLGPLSMSRFAFASVVEDDIIRPLLDSNGDKIVVYRRAGWKHLYADTPELA
jgi:hypothetical protein